MTVAVARDNRCLMFPPIYLNFHDLPKRNTSPALLASPVQHKNTVTM
jgi:hypothetical protein